VNERDMELKWIKGKASYHQSFYKRFLLAIFTLPIEPFRLAPRPSGGTSRMDTRTITLGTDITLHLRLFANITERGDIESEFATLLEEISARLLETVFANSRSDQTVATFAYLTQ
jgi:hypothetical protein